jgi:hypothetical protein
VPRSLSQPVFTPMRIRLDEYQFGPLPYGEQRPDVTNEMLPSL